MFCMNCGNQLPDGAKFCMHCGASLNGSSQAQAVTPVTPVVESIPNYPMELNGVTYNVVELCDRIDLLKIDGMFSRSSSSIKLDEITGLGNSKSTELVFEWEHNEDLKNMVRKYQGIQTPVDDIPRCPKCNSPHIEIDKKGFSGGKAIVAGLFTGPIGLAAGFMGKNDRVGTCLKCGHKWKLGK